MDESTIKQKPLDIDDLFGGETITGFMLKGWEIRCHWRESDTETDLEYQRRSSKTKGAGMKVEISDAALHADLWLFSQLCVKVEVINGEEVQDVADFKARLSPEVKRTALFYYRQRISRKPDEGEQGN